MPSSGQTASSAHKSGTFQTSLTCFFFFFFFQCVSCSEVFNNSRPQFIAQLVKIVGISHISTHLVFEPGLIT